MTVTETDTETRVEIVDPKELERRLAAEQRTAIELRQRDEVSAVADNALAMPGSPGVDEFKSLCLQAKLLSMSAAAPDAVKGNPHVALHIVLIGRDLGISPSAAVEQIDIISTKNGLRPSMSPQLLNGQTRRLGLGSIVKAIDNDERCIALAMAPGGRLDLRCKRAESYPFHWFDLPLYTNPETGERSIPEERCVCICTPELWLGDTEFSWQDAQLAGLAGAECTPHEHKKKTITKNGATWEACPCNFGYIAYWPRMRWWRASGFCCDDYFPEAGLGLYTAEELGAFVDAEGRAIDVDSVEIPPGYEPTKGMAGYVPPPAVLSDEEQQLRVELQMRVLALPPAGQTAYRERKSKMDKIAGIATYQMDGAQLRLTNGMLSGIESQTMKDTAKSDTPWDPEAALDAVRRSIVTAVCRLFYVYVDADSTGEASTSESSSDDARTDEAQPEQPQATTRSRSKKTDPPAVDEQTGQLAEIVTAMSAHAAKLTEVIAAVTAMAPSEVDHMLESDRFMVKMPKTTNIDARKQRLVIELCREYLADQSQQPTLDTE